MIGEKCCVYLESIGMRKPCWRMHSRKHQRRHLRRHWKRRGASTRKQCSKGKQTRVEQAFQTENKPGRGSS